MNGEVRRLVEKYAIGLAADPSDPESIAQGFLAFTRSGPDELQRMSENSICLASTIFNKKMILENFFTHFKCDHPSLNT
jgi:hypothetical protein